MSDAERQQKKLRDNYAKRCFLDKADHDYIAARTMVRNYCFDQALILMQQCIEKYLKAILLYNKISSKDLNHNIEKLLLRCKRDVPKFNISEDSIKLVKKLNGVEHSRYLTYSYHGFYEYFVVLDKTIWQLRIYTQPNYEYIVDDELDKYIGSDIDIVSNGELEKILSLRTNVYGKQKLKENLVWKNLYFYSGKKRKNVLKKIAFGSWSSTSPFDLGDNQRKKDLYKAIEGLIYLPKALRKELENL